MTSFEQREPLWGFQDLMLLIGAILPALLAGAGVVRLGRAVAQPLFTNRAAEVVAFQVAFYVVTLGALYLILAVRHGLPFWRSLGWTVWFRGAWWCLASAPLLVVTISMLGGALRAPIIPNPWEELITGPGARLAMLILVAVAGPLWEELMFRGFLYPLLARLAGPWVGVFGAAAAFGLIHGAQNQWSWQYVVLVALSGVAFGIARYKTGSTAAATLMHSAYNTTLFVVFLLQRA
jgi:hypothetical protein